MQLQPAQFVAISVFVGLTLLAAAAQSTECAFLFESEILSLRIVSATKDNELIETDDYPDVVYLESGPGMTCDSFETNRVTASLVTAIPDEYEYSTFGQFTGPCTNRSGEAR